MICSDDDDYLNPKHISIQGCSSIINDTRRLRLDIDNVKESKLFPGQVIIAKGKSYESRFLILRNDQVLYTDGTLSKPETQKEKNISIVVAKGPFTHHDNFEFKPYFNLLEYVKSTKPSVCILIGPFLDESHPLLESLDDTFSDIFQKKCINPLQNINCKFLLVPSLSDVHHDVIFPQPPFFPHNLKNIQFLPNPSCFSIEGINIGISSVDIINDIYSTTVDFWKENDDDEIIEFLYRNLIQQQSFYPLYPPYHCPISFKNYEKLNLNYTPDILIIPTRKKKFYAKEIEGVLCLNPGYSFENGLDIFTTLKISPTPNKTIASTSRIEFIR